MKPKRLSDQIRAAVDATGRSRYAICKEIKLGQSAMSRFMSGQAGLSLEVLDRLAACIGLTVVVVTTEPEATK